MEIDVVALSGKAIKILGSRNTNGKQLYGRISKKSGISVENLQIVYNGEIIWKYDTLPVGLVRGCTVHMVVRHGDHR